jgi:hypothetical protein
MRVKCRTAARLRGLVLLLGALILVQIPGCFSGRSDEAVVGAESSAPASSLAGQAHVIVTRGYGAEVVVDEVVSLAGHTTAMDALALVADVGTAYGGGFVQGINGIGDTRVARTDWFYAINGVLANRGAAGEVLRDGDVEHWDFREWRFRRNVSATMGCFPTFFVNGYGGRVCPTVVVYGTDYRSEALAIAGVLEDCGVVDVECVDVSSLGEEWQQERNLIIVAGAEDALVRDVYASWDKVGLFTRLETSGLSVFTASGEETTLSGETAGLLQPLQNPWNPSGIGACENVVLLVSGTDSDGVRSAVDALLEHGDTMATWCGAVVQDKVLLPVPLRTPR